MGQFADDEVGQKEDEGEGEKHERADQGEPLVVVEVLALEIGHPVELGHLWRLFTIYYRFRSKQNFTPLFVILSLTYHIQIAIRKAAKLMPLRT